MNSKLSSNIFKACVVGKLVSAPMFPSLTSALTGSAKSQTKIVPDQNPVFTVKAPQKGQKYIRWRNDISSKVISSNDILSKVISSTDISSTILFEGQFVVLFIWLHDNQHKDSQHCTTQN
jgi:hypothetical protein